MSHGVQTLGEEPLTFWILNRSQKKMGDKAAYNDKSNINFHKKHLDYY